jgi:Domain of unknown function (DUF4166)
MLQATPLRSQPKQDRTATFDHSLGDLRFRALLSAQQWNSLPQAVRKRFSKRLAGTASVVYRGHVTFTRMNTAGIVLAQLARLIGGPLPLSRDEGVPAVVTVTEDEATRGQFWSRHYNRHNGFPQVIHSTKRFRGLTGLEECVGRGVGMALKIEVKDGDLLFKSAHYFIQLGAFRLRIPGWLSPGALTVTHRAMGETQFAFILEVTHPVFGKMLHQHAVFEDQIP